MSNGTTVIYRCDGTLAGILCCVFESYTRREVPDDILCADTPCLFAARLIETNDAHARRVYNSLKKLSSEVSNWVETAYLSNRDGIALLLLRFIRCAFDNGARVIDMLADPTVNEMFKVVRSVRMEARRMLEFVRFSDYDGVLISVIEPKYMILPFLKEHFVSRFPEETFAIFDRAHEMALFYRPYEAVIGQAQALELPVESEAERAFRAMWQRYYTTISIEERYNPRCRMSHMPMRFWKHLTEMAATLPGTPSLRHMVKHSPDQPLLSE